jgi:hypothetical protein
VLEIAADNVLVRGFKISGDNPLLAGYDYAGMNVEAGIGIYSEGNNTVLQNNIIEKFTVMGIWAGGTQSTQYQGLTVNANLIRNIHDLNQLGYGFGMYVQGTAGAIQNNVIANTRNGVQIQPYQVVGAVQPSFSGNLVTAWKTGIYYNYTEVGASAWTISGNSVTACAAPGPTTGPVAWDGIKAESMRATGNGGSISGNTVDGTAALADPCHDSWGGYAHAVWGLHYAGASSTSTKVYFENNTVANVAIGFGHDAPADIVLTGNSLSATDAAIQLHRSYNSAGVAQSYGGTNNVDATGGNVINGVNTTTASLSQLFAIEDAIVHKVDDATWGLVRVRAANLYVTTSSARIQRGIDAATAGDTVNVGPGTFKEQVNIVKGVTVIGDEANPGVVIIDGENKTTLAAHGQLRIYNPTGPVLFKGFTITNVACVAGYDYFGILTKGSQAITIQSCRVFGHRSAVDIGCDYGMWAAGGTGELTVSGCYFRDMYHAILLERQLGATTIEDNTFDSLYTGAYSGAQYGGRAIEAIVYGAADVTALQTIRGNTFVNFKSTGVLFSGGFAGQTPRQFTNVLIEENDFNFASTDIVNLLGAVCLKNVSGTLNDNPAGGVTAVVQNNNISVPSGNGIIVSGLNGAITISENSFTSNMLNAVKADQSLGSTISAENNWWGDLTGPANTANPGGTGNAVIGAVDFSPWLADGTDMDLAAIGFQPDLSLVYYRPVSLVFSQQPVGAALGALLTTQPQVTVSNEVGGVATQFNGTVTVRIGNNPGEPVDGVLTGDVTVTVIAGVATFTNLVITQGSGSGFTLVAESTGLASATSAPLDIENNGPSLAVIPAQFVNEQELLVPVAPVVTDTDSEWQTLTFTLDAASLAAGLNIDPLSGVITWAPTESQGSASPYTVTVTVTDDGLPVKSASQTFTITVAEVNVAPVLPVISDQTVNEQETLSFTVPTASDQDLPAQTLTYTLDAASLAAGMTINGTTGAFSWSPSESQGGMDYNVTVTVTDNGLNLPNLTAAQTFKITVSEINVAPVLAPIPPQSVNFGQTLTFTATATDQDRVPTQTLTFSLTDAPAGAAIDPSTGVFTWTPTEAQAKENYSFTVKVTDNGTPAMSDEQLVTIGAVSASHTCPGYWSPSTNMVVSNSLSFGGTLTGLTWTPVLPDPNWVITAVNAGGNGVAVVSNGTAVVFTTPPSTNPVAFTYTVSVPGNAAVSNAVGATVSFNGLTAEVAPIAIYRYHSADYRADVSGSTSGQFRKIDSTEINRVLAYWRYGYKPDAAGLDGFVATSGYAGAGGRHSADYDETPWQISTDEAALVLEYWRQGGYHADPEGEDGYASTRPGPGPSLLMFSSFAMDLLLSPGTTVTGPVAYNPGKTVTVTNIFVTGSTEKLSYFTWNLRVPGGWRVTGISGDGSPLLDPTGTSVLLSAQTLPTTQVRLVVTYSVPLNAAGAYEVGAEARYKFAGMVKALTLSADPLLALGALDADGDGMADTWAATYGITDPSDDEDGDGMNNLAEYLCGTIPQDGTSYLRMVNVKPMPGVGVEVSWSSEAGRTYILLRAQGKPEGFTEFKRDLPAGPSGRSSTVDESVSTEPCFYRVKLQQ